MSRIFKNRKVFKLKEIDSTNLYASKLKPETPEGSLVWADYQILGRGQGLNKWESIKGQNLTFSVLLRPTFLKAMQQFYLSKIISLSIADFLSPILLYNRANKSVLSAESLISMDQP